MHYPATPQRSSLWRTPPACERPRGFTLVELLAVIMIIAMLAALVTPAVMQALSSARNAAIKSEIDMLHMAVMNYKSEYGVLPPSLDALVSGSYTAGGAAAKHLKRLFPRCPDTAGQANAGFVSLNGNRISLTPLNALWAWLGGYTTDPQSPLFPAKQRQKLYDFDTSRVNPSTGAYFPSGKPSSPYIYIDAPRYLTVTGSLSSNVYRAQCRVTLSGTAFFNSDNFQILSAGRDEIWDEDANMNGVLEPSEDLNGNGVWDKSDDDLSNFWPGTRRDYLESLTQ